MYCYLKKDAVIATSGSYYLGLLWIERPLLSTHRVFKCDETIYKIKGKCIDNLKNILIIEKFYSNCKAIKRINDINVTQNIKRYRNKNIA